VLKFDFSLSFKASILPYATGTIAALITGYLSLKLLSSIIRKGHLYYFSPYCVTVGSLVLLFTLF
jgi:undecaprenyl pyrophosphate phosphatase UppP